MNVQIDLNYKQRNITRLLTCVFGIITFFFVHENTKASMLLGAILALMFSNPKLVYALVKTVPRDIIAITRFIRMNIFMLFNQWRGWTIPHIVQYWAQKQPSKTCLVLGDRSLTFKDVEDLSNKVGAYFKTRGLQRGDCVALLMETRLEYACFWLGLSKIGVRSALLNSHQRGQSLLHSIKMAEANAIIVGGELSSNITELFNHSAVSQLPIYEYSDVDNNNGEHFTPLKDAIDLRTALETQQNNNLHLDMCKCKPKDIIMYVYTSGTTGMPKAAIITHIRMMFMASGTYYMLALQCDDIIYNPLPLYHSAGGMVGLGMALVHGCTVVLRRKFSVSNFWKDCVRYQCTVGQYIGELCRYLLVAPHQPEERLHTLRLMYGNGLRPQIWTQFVSRFNIQQIGEVYGSTEGNSNLANLNNHVGAVGFLPIIGRKFSPIQIVRCDENGEILRNNNGLCVRCEPGETGLLIGQVNARHANTAFNGYADSDASEQKLLHNVFTKDDLYFNTGDMMISDLLGYVYFKDRTGDTFRWRGENVATLEVEAIIMNVVGLKDCVVFGVEIPHAEGKAGMAVIVDPENKVDCEHLSAGIRGSLPPYARPLFIRLTDAIPCTSTHKMQKRDLMDIGFHINRTKDPIYYLNKDSIYRPLTQQQYENILSGTAGL